MFAVWKYTFKRTLLNTSTYVVFTISAGLSALMIFSMGPIGGTGLTYIFFASMFFSLIFGLLVPVFISSKASIPLRQEIEEGTLLTIIAKPITRTRIVVAKWLALMSALAVFSTILFVTLASLLMMANVEGTTPKIETAKIISSSSLAGMFTFLVYAGIGTILLILSLKISTKLLTAVALVFGISVMIIPGIIGVTSLTLRADGSTVIMDESIVITTQQEKDYYTNQVNEHAMYNNVVKWVDFTYHMENMYQELVALPISTDLGDVFGDGTGEETGDFTATKFTHATYEITDNGDGTWTVKTVDFIEPFVLYIMYSILLLGVGIFGIRYLKRKDFS